MQKRSGLRGAFNRARGFGRGLQGGSRFSRLGMAGLVLGGTDAVLRMSGVPGSEGGLLSTGINLLEGTDNKMFGLNPLAGKKRRDTITGSTAEGIQMVRDRGFEDKGSVTMAKMALGNIQDELAKTGDEKTKVILQKQIEEAEEIVKKYEELLKKQNEQEAKITSGALIRKDTASRLC